MSIKYKKVHPERTQKVFVAMSGGVDSSVAAYLLKNEGYEVTGVFIRSFNIDGCEERDSEDARRVAEKIEIPFYVWDFEKEYVEKVVNYMIGGYRRGITPNPDVMCNRYIKFGVFLDKALSLGADYMATGHYVRLRRTQLTNDNKQLTESQMSDVTCQMFSAHDAQKDQSYFLWTLTNAQLKHCLFPIGDYLKSEVRDIARKAGLPNADKKDSQGICFLGKISLSDFLKKHIQESRGDIITANGDKIGTHTGAAFYTVGQRHLGTQYQVSGVKQDSETKPFYVAKKDVGSNTLTVAHEEDSAMYSARAILADVNFIDEFPESTNEKAVLARIRYRQPLQNATLFNLSGEWNLVFGEPQKAIAPGQSAVFYCDKESGFSDGTRMLGGGIIASALHS